MKEFLQELVKQKSSMLILAGMLLLILGITNGIQSGVISIVIDPAYRIIAIVIGVILVLVGIILIGRDSFDLKSKTKSSGDYSRRGSEISLSLEKAAQIDALGYSLRSLVHDQQDTFARAIVNGACVRFLLIKPDGKAIDMMQQIKPETGIVKDIYRSLEIAQKSIWEKSKQTVRGKFEIRMIDWIPSCALLILNGTSENGWMEVGVFPPNFRKSVGHKLFLYFTAKNDKARFNEYAEEFNELWEMATPYKI